MEGCCETCNQWEEHYYWNHLDVKRMHFFKIMMGDFSRRLCLPKKFTGNFKGDLLTAVELKGPSGGIWRVGLVKDEDSMFLSFGWRAFIRDHDIHEDDLLVFKFNGSSCFDVVLLDETGCEKASAYFAKNQAPLNKYKGANSAKSQKSLKRRGCTTPEKSSPRNFPRTKRKSTSGDCRPRNVKRTKTDDHSFHLNKTLRRTREEIRIPKGANCRSKYGRKKLTEEQKKGIPQLTGAIKEGNPCFYRVLHPSYMTKAAKRASRYRLHLPLKFMMTHLPGSRSVVLQTPGRDNKWPFSFYLCEKACYSNTENWKEFVFDNDLKEGDICAFELVKGSSEILFNVHISRLGERGS